MGASCDPFKSHINQSHIILYIYICMCVCVPFNVGIPVGWSQLFEYGLWYHGCIISLGPVWYNIIPFPQLTQTRRITPFSTGHFKYLNRRYLLTVCVRCTYMPPKYNLKEVQSLHFDLCWFARGNGCHTLHLDGFILGFTWPHWSINPSLIHENRSISISHESHLHLNV